MILATVGTQLPFPRLLAALDRIAALHCLEMFAQTADPSWIPRYIAATPHLSPEEFGVRAAGSRLLVGHAGIGTVLTAKKLQKPLVIFPRRADLNEHRNDHQAATARALETVPGCHVAWDERQLEELMLRPGLQPGSMEASPRRDALIESLRLFISADRRQRAVTAPGHTRAQA